MTTPGDHIPGKRQPMQPGSGMAMDNADTVFDVTEWRKEMVRILSEDGAAAVKFGDSPSIDSFARLRVSNPQTLFDSKQLHDKQPLFWDEALGSTGSTGTYQAGESSTRMGVTSATGTYVIRQTKQRFNYQPGKSQLSFMTFTAPSSSDVKQRVGQFVGGTGGDILTPSNGIWFENNGGSLSFNVAKGGTTTETATQANWNVDVLDGSGDDTNPSGLLLDMDASQILAWDYEWLGVGRVRMGFVINGAVIYCHYFNHANMSPFSSVYMSTPNNPLRYDIQNTGSGSGYMDHICSTLMSEGGQQNKGLLRTINTDHTHVDANTADVRFAILGLRLKSSHLDVTVLLNSINIINQNADDFKWALLLNPTVNGTFTYTDLAGQSAVQFALGLAATTITAGNEGLEIVSGYTSSDTETAQASLENALTLGSKVDETRDEIVLSVTPLSGGADIHAAINFRELL